ncbi:hypothetical protein [Amycolatopsis sp. FDAARGOS 1241]|uniref:hypothetical protein n=1 Tax=Amycolatopsis sp. FDAARGOS 1241 TaxID=2778070 RepID=UPI001951329B|nr:hypothetical protein [Amycolatopsis sp. FDAARGOS 1241]QRP42804.1 hypothetical protein I6J71_25390 [Amycolatopsis sp. FDAARGOS 1241]
MSDHPLRDDDADPAEVLALADRVRETPGEGTVSLLAERSRGWSSLGEIRVATEATVGALLEFPEQYPTGSGSPIQLVPSAIEPPS